MRHVKRLSALLGTLAFLLALDAPLDAHAQVVTPPGKDDPTLRSVHPERRNGVVLGISGGGALAGASGSPSDPKISSNPAYYQSSPLLGGFSTSYFLMGALNDYVSFGPNVTIATMESAHWKSTGFGIGFRGEFFPLVKAVPALADLAIYTQLGLGSTELRAKGPYPTAGGTQSFLGIGLHHEWRLTRLLGGHAAAGPYLEYDSIRTTSFERHWASAGLRVVWYGGSVALDR